MREIEFRAWYKPEGYILSGDELQTGIAGSLNEYFIDKDYLFMQFTGLRDKNGVKLFEGDIIEADGIDYESGNYARGEIVFIDGEFSIQYMHLDRNLYERIISAKRETVVGNKHQHPHLLEQKK